MASGSGSFASQASGSIPTKNEMLTLIDLFEIKDVRAAVEAYWPWDDDQLEKLREDQDREKLRKENEMLKSQNANMLKTMQDMAKKNEHVKAEMDEIVEALCTTDWGKHERARQQAVALQKFLG